jgi:uncharacterized protein affecting Mg2+/Co2+ transport
MRILLATLLLCVASVVVASQDDKRGAQEPSGVTVIKSSWSKERINWEGDPFAGPLENFDEMRARARNEKRIDDAKRGGNQLDLNKAERDARADAANMEAVRKQQNKPARYVFAYKLSLRNDGAKAIRVIDWDYVFFDKGTTREVGRRQFTSEAKIAPGKSKELSVIARLPPAQTVSVQSLNEKERDALDGQIEIVRIEYTDGTIWKRP